MTVFSPPPRNVDRVIVHQFDPARPSPGGIDTCLRGICKYFPPSERIAVIGVDTGSGPRGRKIGQWEKYENEGRTFWFLPVARLDPADQARRIPHSVRLLTGIVRHRRRIPQSPLLHVHRMDSAAALRVILPREQVYFIHTQENGLVGTTSDSFWRFLGNTHQRIERFVVRKARAVVVFNEDYASIVRQWNPAAVFSPTWYDPELIEPSSVAVEPHRIIWVGRLEVPKDPGLAVRAFAELAAANPTETWTLELLGSGTLLDTIQAEIDANSTEIASKISLRGRVAPEEVARTMSTAGVFLMTSHPGYEGYARVLVEAMASGLPPVVTDGSDTGGLVVDGVTGFVTNREPHAIAHRLSEAIAVSRSAVMESVANLDAPSLIGKIFALHVTPHERKVTDPR